MSIETNAGRGARHSLTIAQERSVGSELAGLSAIIRSLNPKTALKTRRLISRLATASWPILMFPLAARL